MVYNTCQVHTTQQHHTATAVFKTEGTDNQSTTRLPEFFPKYEALMQAPLLHQRNEHPSDTYRHPSPPRHGYDLEEDLIDRRGWTDGPTTPTGIDLNPERLEDAYTVSSSRREHRTHGLDVHSLCAEYT